MSSFINWMDKYGERISWFIIGVMTQQGLTQLGRGDYEGAALSFGIAALNVFLTSRK